MKKDSTCIFLCVSCTTSTRKDSLKSAMESHSLETAFDHYFEEYVKKHMISGVITIINKNDVIYENSFDPLNQKEGKFNIHSQFQIGSITKMFTVYLCLLAEEKGMLNIEDSVVSYLPETELDNNVKIHHLMSNKSGIPDYSLSLWYLNHLDKPFIEKDNIKWVRDKKPKYVPGEDWNYSNFNFVLIGLLLEKITNKDVGQIYEEWIFRPLKMQNTGFGINNNKDNIAVPNTSFWGITWPTRKQDYEMSYTAGNIFSTVYDLNLWLDEIFNGRLISGNAKEKMQTSYSELFENVGYGYGCYIEKREFGNSLHTIIGHSGGVSGFSTMISIDMDNQLKIIVLNNIRNMSNVYLQEQIEADCYEILRSYL